jgi:hypothetical protein
VCPNLLERVKFIIKRNLDQRNLGLGTVAHACNTSYSGGGYWEDCNLRPAQAESSQDCIEKLVGWYNSGLG